MYPVGGTPCVRGERGVPIKGRAGKGAVRVRGLPPAITLTAPAPAAPPYPYSPARAITYGCVRVRVHPHKGKGGPLTRRSPCSSGMSLSVALYAPIAEDSKSASSTYMGEVGGSPPLDSHSVGTM